MDNIQSVPFKTQPNNSHILWHKNEWKLVHHLLIDFPIFPPDTLDVRPLTAHVSCTKPVQVTHGVLWGRLCVHP